MKENGIVTSIQLSDSPIPIKEARVKVERRRWIPPAWAKHIPKRYWRYLIPFGTYLDWETVGEYPLDLLTNGGRDLLHAAIIYASSQGPGFSYYAVTNAATFTPAVTDTTFPSEVTGSGMARHQPTGTGESVSHTAGQNTSVSVVIFTNNTAGTITGIKGYANFTTNVATQPCFELAFTSTDLPIGDSLKLTITYTMG